MTPKVEGVAAMDEDKAGGEGEEDEDKPAGKKGKRKVWMGFGQGWFVVLAFVLTRGTRFVMLVWRLTLTSVRLFVPRAGLPGSC